MALSNLARMGFETAARRNMARRLEAAGGTALRAPAGLRLPADPDGLAKWAGLTSNLLDQRGMTLGPGQYALGVRYQNASIDLSVLGDGWKALARQVRSAKLSMPDWAAQVNQDLAGHADTWKLAATI